MKLCTLMLIAGFCLMTESSFAEHRLTESCQSLTSCIEMQISTHKTPMHLNQDQLATQQRLYRQSSSSDAHSTQDYYQQNRALYQQLRDYEKTRQFQVRNDRKSYRSNRNQLPVDSGIYRKTNQFQPHQMPGSIPSRGEKVFIFNPRILTWAAYDASGDLVRKGHGSGGSSYCADIKRSCRTPSGSYRIIEKRGANCVSSRYPKPRGGAKMPYCMFFSKYYAVHGSDYVPFFNASHGCIRVYPQDAQWLNREFLSYGTRVIVESY